MPKYNVTLYYSTSACVEVEADDEDEAVDIAREMDLDEAFREGMQENGKPDVELVSDEDEEDDTTD